MLSKSRGAFVEVPYFLSRYDPGALRFYLTATAPETRDTEACPEEPTSIPNDCARILYHISWDSWGLEGTALGLVAFLDLFLISL